MFDAAVVTDQLGGSDLLKENRVLKRQLRSLESLLERNKSMLSLRNSVNALLTTQQKKMEQNMQLLLDNSPDIILLFDQKNLLTYCTKTFLVSANISDPAHVVGKNPTEIFGDILSPTQMETLDGCFQCAIDLRSPVTVNDEIRFAQDSGFRHFKISINPMTDDLGNAEGAMLLFHDLTDILKAMADAEKANSAKSEFLATMSHEMRTPLNAIIGMAYLSRNTTVQEKRDSALLKIEDASNNLLGVINDILDMSKIEAGLLELSEAPFELGRVLANAVGVIQHRLDEKEIQFTLQQADDVPNNCFGDSQHLWQVITNLLSNAVKFTPREGAIHLDVSLLKTKGKAKKLRIAVTDTGIGISPENQKKLFNSFVQADNSISRRFGGTGLGLVISKSIITLMGGEIGITSEEGKGSCFAFSVWLTEIEEPCKRVEKKELTPQDYEGLFADKRILLAEDIEINQEIVMSLLEPTQASFTTAGDGHEALRIFVENDGNFDLVLMDIHMPGMDGYEATRQIRSSSVAKGATVPIVAMTANTFKEDIQRCLSVGMNAHLSKPLVVDAMMQTITSYLCPEE